jgi:hypothetical protein
MSIRKSRYANGQRTKRNFSGETTTVDAAVATANLVTLLDPDKVGGDEVEVIAAATGTEEVLVEALVDLVDQANEAEGTAPDEEIVQNFSRSVRNLVAGAKSKRRRSKNFSAEDTAKSVVEVAEIVGMLDDDALDMVPAADIAATVSEATGTDAEVVEAIIEVAQNNFSIGKKFGFQSATRFTRGRKMNFSTDSVEPLPTVDPDKPAVAGSTEEVVVQQLPVESVVQEPVVDPVAGEGTSKPVDAGEVMALQQDMVTAQSVADAAGNFSRPSTKKNAVLLSILGDKYIPNEA